MALAFALDRSETPTVIPSVVSFRAVLIAAGVNSLIGCVLFARRTTRAWRAFCVKLTAWSSIETLKTERQKGQQMSQTFDT